MNSGTLAGFLSKFPLQVFRPVAYYDKHMDCIRVVLRDCSVLEHRVSDFITVMEDNFPQRDQSRHVGLVLKGISCLFKEWGLPLEGVYKFTDILDAFVKSHPEAFASALSGYAPLIESLRNTEIEFDMAA